jgi:hypothetical protein
MADERNLRVFGLQVSAAWRAHHGGDRIGSRRRAASPMALRPDLTIGLPFRAFDGFVEKGLWKFLAYNSGLVKELRGAIGRQRV